MSLSLYSLFENVEMFIDVCEFFAKIISKTINFSNFSLGKLSGNIINSPNIIIYVIILKC